MAEDSPGFQARRLLRAARVGTLATTDPGGQPFASLVTPATAPDSSPLLLISSLAEHTRHLRADPRCALLVAGLPESTNPQTTPRVTITGTAEPIDDAALKARWLAIHPYAALYADFADFSLWRIRPAAALLVSGFARATRLRATDLQPNRGAVAALTAAEAGIITHCNTDHAAAMTLLGGGAGPWRMVTADVDGCDLAPADPEAGPVRRIAWAAPVGSAEALRGELVRLLHRARSG
ncbi:MAG: pyridoxamine 5'-phosphate oxidase family protein [Alphaproteobacteria bacterium]|nr:pyridoxamine 5'-phosphate oxidase family protein [Alphaproteobacteria bacterium]